MITLRPLNENDVQGMQEWMNDDSINAFFDLLPSQKTEESIRHFIQTSQTDRNHHYAIVNEQDEYLGTISLKNIHLKNKHAEYAIVLRKKAQGLGIGFMATQALLNIAKVELHLHKVYLTVLKENQYAIRMYEKAGFKHQGLFQDHLFQNGQYRDLLYFERILEENV